LGSREVETYRLSFEASAGGKFLAKTMDDRGLMARDRINQFLKALRRRQSANGKSERDFVRWPGLEQPPKAQCFSICGESEHMALRSDGLGNASHGYQPVSSHSSEGQIHLTRSGHPQPPQFGLQSSMEQIAVRGLAKE
jgi:hypothetical protein